MTTKQQEFLESLKDPHYVVGKGVVQAMNDLRAQHADYIKSIEIWKLNGVTTYHVDVYVTDHVDIYTTRDRIIIIDMKDSIKHHVQKYNEKAIIEFVTYPMHHRQPRNKDKFYIVIKI